MSKYSTPLEYGVPLTEVDLHKEYVYKCFVDHYNDPIMSKIKDDEHFSVYACKTTCMLINKCRYLIATVKKDAYQLGTRFNLSEIEWINFQTRVLEGKYDVPVHYFEPSTKHPMNSEIKESTKNEKISSYNCDFLEIKVYLLHTKGNSLWEYARIGKLCNALETYQTIITF
jgi:hypothetical protein